MNAHMKQVNGEQITVPPSSTSLPTSYYGNEFNSPFHGLNKQSGNPVNDSSSGFSSSSSMSSDNSFDNFGNGNVQENFLPEIKAFSNNSDKLEGVLGHLNATHLPNTFTQSKTNPFAMLRDKNSALNDLKGMELSKSFPLAGKIHSLTGNGINYDALRETTDYDVFNTTSTSGLSCDTLIEKPEKSPVAIDLFKDAAAAAFNELGGSNGNKVRKHEFYNKISEQAFASAEKVKNLWLH